MVVHMIILAASIFFDFKVLQGLHCVCVLMLVSVHQCLKLGSDIGFIMIPGAQIPGER